MRRNLLVLIAVLFALGVWIKVWIIPEGQRSFVIADIPDEVFASTGSEQLEEPARLTEANEPPDASGGDEQQTPRLVAIEVQGEDEDWLSYPRSSRTYPSLVVHHPEMIKVQGLYRHPDLNPTDRIIGASDRSELQSLVGDRLHKIKQVRSVGSDAVVREMNLLIANGIATKVSMKHPHAVSDSPKYTDDDNMAPAFNTFTFPRELLTGGAVFQLGTPAGGSAYYARVKDLPVTKAATVSALVLSQELSREIIAFFVGRECITVSQGGQLTGKVEELINEWMKVL